MIEFDFLNVPQDIKTTLGKYNVDFAFQTIYFKNQTIFGYEALMRPDNMSVLDFIKEAEENGYQHDLELLSFFGGTLAYGLRGYTKKLCINSLPTECLTEEEYKAYWDCFEKLEKQLIVELVEYADYESWASRVKSAHIKAREGVQISIDDFGTANNDITRVRQMSPNIVKIDKSIITNIHTIESMQKMVDQLVYRFHEMGILVLAEGVETKEEYDYLQTTDVDLYQGYYLSKPQ